jgi:hypothetical protein
MKRELLELVGNERIRARKEACAHAVGETAKAQVEARRLELRIGERRGKLDRARCDQALDSLGRQDAAWGRLFERLVIRACRPGLGHDRIVRVVHARCLDCLPLDAKRGIAIIPARPRRLDPGGVRPAVVT